MVVGVALAIPLQASDWSHVYEKVEKESLVRIVLGTDDDAAFLCTGEVIAPHTVLTAAHCTLHTHKEDGMDVYLDRMGTYYHGDLMKVDKYLDLALINVYVGPKKPIKMAPYNPAPGSEVAGIGFHSSPMPLILNGIVVADPVEMHTGTNLMPISRPLLHGMSGGPLVNQEGELVGVDVSTDDVIGFAVPIATVRVFVEGVK